MAFKVMTTSRELFIVCPNYHIIPPYQSKNIIISINNVEKDLLTNLRDDERFMIRYIPLNDNDDISDTDPKTFPGFWKNNSKEFRKRSKSKVIPLHFRSNNLLQDRSNNISSESKSSFSHLLNDIDKAANNTPSGTNKLHILEYEKHQPEIDTLETTFKTSSFQSAIDPPSYSLSENQSNLLDALEQANARVRIAQVQIDALKSKLEETKSAQRKNSKCVCM